MINEETIATGTDQCLIFREIEWLRRSFRHAADCYFNKIPNGSILQPLELSEFPDPYADFLRKNEFSSRERLLLILALVPHIDPAFLDTVINDVLPKSGDFPQIGGARGKAYRGMLPTLEMGLFVLTGGELSKRLDLLSQVKNASLFREVLQVKDVPSGEPFAAGLLTIKDEYIQLLTSGTVSRPVMSGEFPAQYISTDLDWDDLVLQERTREQLDALGKWLKHHKVLMNDWGMKARVSPGFRALFHGPPGTGKTLTATLLGKYTGRDVYRVDLSTVVSKYIGETEKNLANLFNRAENKGWILFFDEADALFGKRTNVKDAHDRFANQEISYLLQRTESYQGMVILASNFRHNIDDAFARRFQAHVHFPPPKTEERILLWQKAIPEHVSLEKGLKVQQLAKQYELTGANIMNVVQYACIESIARGTTELLAADIRAGIELEYSKEGKIM